MAETWLSRLERWSKVAACIGCASILFTFHHLLKIVFGSHWLALVSMSACAGLAWFCQESEEEEEERENAVRDEFLSMLQRRRNTIDRVKQALTGTRAADEGWHEDERGATGEHAAGQQQAHADEKEPDDEDELSGTAQEYGVGRQSPQLDEDELHGEYGADWLSPVVDGEEDLDQLREECARLEQLLAASDDGMEFSCQAPSPAMRAYLKELLRLEFEDGSSQSDDADNDGNNADAADDTDSLTAAAVDGALDSSCGERQDPNGLRRRRPQG